MFEYSHFHSDFTFTVNRLLGCASGYFVFGLSYQTLSIELVFYSNNLHIRLSGPPPMQLNTGNDCILL